jgi:hypothetical protein
MSTSVPTSIRVSTANRDIAGARYRSLTFLSFTSLVHTTAFDSSVKEKPISAVVSMPDCGNPFFCLAFHGYQLSNLFSYCSSKDYVSPTTILAFGNVPRVRRTQFESIGYQSTQDGMVLFAGSRAARAKLPRQWRASVTAVQLAP